MLLRDQPNLRVLICVDSDFSRARLASGLEEDRRVTVSGACPPGDCAAHVAEGPAPDVILLDAGSEERATADMVAALRAAAPTSALCLIARLPSGELSDRVRAAGADGFVRLGDPPQTIRRRLRESADERRGAARLTG